MDDMLLLRLIDCAESSRKGMADQGFPLAMSQLSALGMVDPSGAGYKISEAGLAFLASAEIRQRIRHI